MLLSTGIRFRTNAVRGDLAKLDRRRVHLQVRQAVVRAAPGVVLHLGKSFRTFFFNSGGRVPQGFFFKAKFIKNAEAFVFTTEVLRGVLKTGQWTGLRFTACAPV